MKPVSFLIGVLPTLPLPVESRAMSKPSLALVSLGLGLAVALGAGCGPAADKNSASAPAVSAEEAGRRAKEILAQDSPLERIADMSALLLRCGPDAVPALLEAYEGAPLDGGDPEIVLLATWWSAFDPKAAFAWTSSDWRATYGAVIAAVFRGWAHSDPQSALKAAGTLRFAGQLDLARDAVYSGWDESGHPGLEEALTAAGLADQQRFAEILARRRVVSLGAEGAIRWAESQGSPAFQQMMKVRVASAAAGTKSGAAVVAKWATPQIVAAKAPTGFPRRIGTRWIVHDPDGALAWLASLPEGEDRSDGVAESFRDWMRRDFVKAKAWADATGSGEIPRWAEPALAIYAKTNALEHPEESLVLIGRFSDVPLREATTVSAARLWLQNDHDAARAWIDKNLTPELAARVGGKTERPNLPREQPRKRRGGGAQPAPPAEEGDEPTFAPFVK
jgi:hypothetical protein